VTDCASLIAVDISGGLAMSGALELRNNPVLVTVNVTGLVPADAVIGLENDALDVATVNAILARCVAAGLTTASIDLSGGTNAAPAGQGILDKATLIGNGCAVSTN
jgi:hypothetical protein